MQVSWLSEAILESVKYTGPSSFMHFLSDSQHSVEYKLLYQLKKMDRQMQKSFAALSQNFDVLDNHLGIGNLKRNVQTLQEEEINFLLPCRSTEELLHLCHQIKHDEEKKRTALVSNDTSSSLYIFITKDGTDTGMSNNYYLCEVLVIAVVQVLIKH